jgi:hypothetical protein
VDFSTAEAVDRFGCRGIPFLITHKLVIKTDDRVVYFKVFYFIC